MFNSEELCGNFVPFRFDEVPHENFDMSNNNAWWYYMMGRESVKHSGREVSTGAFVFMLVLFIIGLLVFAGVTVMLAWAFLG